MSGRSTRAATWFAINYFSGQATTAVAYSDYGSGNPSELTEVARIIKELDIVIPRALAALHIAGKRNTAADAQPRFKMHVSARDPYPACQLRGKFRNVAKWV